MIVIYSVESQKTTYIYIELDILILSAKCFYVV